MIDNYIENVFRKIEKKYVWCFVTTLIAGLFAHMYAMSNHLYNYDELWHTPTGFGTGIGMGRYGLSFLATVQKLLFKDTYTIPMVNGLITIVCYAVVACLIIAAIDIKSKTYAAIIGGLVITFPAIVTRFFYMFTVHYYAIGAVFSALGALLFIKSCEEYSCESEKKSKDANAKTVNLTGNIVLIAVAVIFIVFGTSVYQTNFTLSVCILFGYLLKEMLKEEWEIKYAIKNSAIYLGVLVASMVLYLITNSIVLKVFNTTMIDHSENYDTIGRITLSQALGSLKSCYFAFVKMSFRNVYSMNPTIVVKLAFLVCQCIFVYTFYKYIKSKRKVAIKMLFTVLMIAMPVAVNLSFILGVSSGILYSIMLPEIVFMFVFAIVCLENVECIENRANNKDSSKQEGENICTNGIMIKGLNALALASFIVSMAVYIWFANGNYLALQYTNEHDKAYYTVLMAQIKSVDGYTDEMPVVLIGKPKDDQTNNRKDMIGKTFNLGGKTATNLGQYSSWNIMTRVIGFDPVVKDSDEDEEYYYNLDEVKSMPVYPDAGALKVIDDTLVIKFQNIEDIDK